MAGPDTVTESVTDERVTAALIPALALHRLLSGSRAHGELLDRYGDAAAVFRAPRGELQVFLPKRPDLVDALRAGHEAVDIAESLAWADAPDCHILTRDDPRYPARLRQLPDPPPLLFVRGNVAALSSPQLAVVGSRNPTPQGEDHARAFAGALAQAGLTITSGLALGIDTAAHAGAMAAGGQTIAVMGTGPDRIYPARHRSLAHEITQHGALVTEFPLGTKPRPECFPQRNRLISGLSLGVLVVEAALESGSLITARFAAEQGREVYAIPGSIHSPLARGCHRLIRDGAKLVESAQDVIEELAAQFVPSGAAVTGTGISGTKGADAANDMGPEQIADSQRLLDALGYDPADTGLLITRTGLTAARVSSMLMLMEMARLVVALPGGRYTRALSR